MVALAVLVSGWSAVAETPKRLTVAVPGINFLYLAFLFAIDDGYFAREGLEVSLFTTGRRDLAMKAVMAGEAFATAIDPVEGAIARSRGAEVKLIAPVIITAAVWLVADKAITIDPTTWRGKTATLVMPPNTQYSLFLKELANGGWTAVDLNTYKLRDDTNPADYLKINVGAFGTDIVTMMAGRANMSAMLEPGVSTALLRGDKHVLHDYSAEADAFLFTAVHVMESSIRKDPETVQHFVTALTKAYRDMPSKTGAVVAAAVKAFPKTDPDLLWAAAQKMQHATPANTTALFTRAAYEKNLEYLALSQPTHPALGVKWDDIADTRFAEAAVKAAGE
jgi:NitT/TauT family transport system substrate-binding protein